MLRNIDRVGVCIYGDAKPFKGAIAVFGNGNNVPATIKPPEAVCPGSICLRSLVNRVVADVDANASRTFGRRMTKFVEAANGTRQVTGKGAFCIVTWPGTSDKKRKPQ